MLLLLPQIEGGFVQGMGWLCLEEMIWGDKVGSGGLFRL
jgi:xanthine dehydrogenase molybdopterin-binding subunit B